MERKEKEHHWRARISPQWFARGKEKRLPSSAGGSGMVPCMRTREGHQHSGR